MANDVPRCGREPEVPIGCAKWRHAPARWPGHCRVTKRVNV